MEVKIAAVMTAARYENTWCRNQIEFALRSMGIPLTVSGGVYYGQCMQLMLEDAVKNGVEYAVTIDGDTVFYPHQLQRLISVIVQEKDTIDAITGMQVRRGMKSMLGTIEGKTQAEWDGYPIKVDTAHFGLTVINLKKLANTQKPWFFCQPDANGEWKTDKIDSDVWFWKQWREAGNSLYIDPEVRIGHVEEMVVMHDEDLSVKHIYPADWVARKEHDSASITEELATV